MTVYELTIELQKFDPTMEVVVPSEVACKYDSIELNVRSLIKTGFGDYYDNFDMSDTVDPDAVQVLVLQGA